MQSLVKRHNTTQIVLTLIGAIHVLLQVLNVYKKAWCLHDSLLFSACDLLRLAYIKFICILCVYMYVDPVLNDSPN